MPINNPRNDWPALIKTLREHEKQRGRGSLSLSLFGAPPKEEPLHQLIELGFERLLFPLPPAPRETVMPMIKASGLAIPLTGPIAESLAGLTGEPELTGSGPSNVKRIFEALARS